MSNIIRPKRSKLPNHRPEKNISREGELYTNTADLQIGVHDVKGNPIDYLAIRVFSDKAKYKMFDLAVYNGAIYKALIPIQPGPFNPTRWENISQSGLLSSLMPTPKHMDRGKALVVDSNGKAQWGAEINNAAQTVNGGQF
jgi:hypothetical protein